MGIKQYRTGSPVASDWTVKTNLQVILLGKCHMENELPHDTQTRAIPFVEEDGSPRLLGPHPRGEKKVLALGSFQGITAVPIVTQKHGVQTPRVFQRGKGTIPVFREGNQPREPMRQGSTTSRGTAPPVAIIPPQIEHPQREHRQGRPANPVPRIALVHFGLDNFHPVYDVCRDTTQQGNRKGQPDVFSHDKPLS